MKRNFLFTFSIAIVCVVFFGAMTLRAQEVSPYKLVATWQANNLYPANYEGKSLPSENTPVRVSVAVLNNGKLVDASGTPFKWYIDNSFYDSGVGESEITFNASARRGTSQMVKVQIQTDAGDTVSQFIQIPIQPKEIVIESPLTQNTIPANSSVLFTVVPYFFNANSLSDLDITWSIQNQEVSGEKSNTLFVQFGTPATTAQQNIKVTAGVQESQGSLETATYSVPLQIQK